MVDETDVMEPTGAADAATTQADPTPARRRSSRRRKTAAGATEPAAETASPSESVRPADDGELSDGEAATPASRRPRRRRSVAQAANPETSESANTDSQTDAPPSGESRPRSSSGSSDQIEPLPVSTSAPASEPIDTPSAEIPSDVSDIGQETASAASTSGRTARSRRSRRRPRTPEVSVEAPADNETTDSTQTVTPSDTEPAVEPEAAPGTPVRSQRSRRSRSRTPVTETVSKETVTETPVETSDAEESPVETTPEMESVIEASGFDPLLSEMMSRALQRAAEADQSAGEISVSSERPRRPRREPPVAPPVLPSHLAVSTTEGPVVPEATKAVETERAVPRGRREARGTGRPNTDGAQAEQPVATQPAAVQSPSSAKTEKPAAPKRVRTPRVVKPAVSREPKPRVKFVPAPASESMRIGLRKAHPEILVRGKPVPPFFFFGFTQDSQNDARIAEQIGLAAASGIHLHMLFLEIPVDEARQPDTRDRAVELIRMARQADPEALVMLRLFFVPTPGWMHRYPGSAARYGNTRTEDPSFFADEFWMEAELSVARLAELLEETPEAEYLLGYHLDCREWFHDYQRGLDRCDQAREAFRRWLTVRYNGDVVALRAAWHNGSVTFADAEAPDRPIEQNVAIFDTHRDQAWMDALCFHSETVARRIAALSRAAKRAGMNRRLIAVSYGYTFDFPSAASGHLALNEVLSTGSIDIICAPPSHRDRGPQGAASIATPADSVLMHEKLYIVEDDTKPYTAQVDADDFNPRMPDAETTDAARWRTIGSAMTLQSGVAWMDLWGEGWLKNPDHWRRAGRLNALYAALIERRKTTPPDVAVVVDEKSLYRIRDLDKLLTPLLEQHRECFVQAGIRFGIYLQSDIPYKAFPDSKLVIFINPLQMDTDVREAVKSKLQRDGRVLVWMYAPALWDENGATPDGPREVAGISLRPLPWNSEVGSVIVSDRHPITRGLRDQAVGVRERLNPAWYSIDDQAQVLGAYVETSLPSIVVRDHGSWKTVFVGERRLTVELVRGLCRWLDIPVYHSGNAFVRVSPPFISVQAREAGEHSIQLPAQHVVFDLTTNEWRPVQAGSVRLQLRAGETHLLLAGPADDIRPLTDVLGVEFTPVISEEPQPEALNGASISAIKKRRRRGGRRHRKPRENGSDGAVNPTDGVAGEQPSALNAASPLSAAEQD